MYEVYSESTVLTKTCRRTSLALWSGPSARRKVFQILRTYLVFNSSTLFRVVTIRSCFGSAVTRFNSLEVHAGGECRDQICETHTCISYFWYGGGGELLDVMTSRTIHAYS